MDVYILTKVGPVVWENEIFHPGKLLKIIVEHIEQIKEEIETRKKMIQCLQDPNRRITSSSESFRLVWLAQLSFWASFLKS